MADSRLGRKFETGKTLKHGQGSQMSMRTSREVHAQVKHQMEFLRKHYEFQVKQLKPEMQTDALNFLREKGAQMLHRFNQEMHTLVLHF